MYIKRIAEFRLFFQPAKDLVALINSNKDIFIETIIIKNDGKWGVYTQDIKLTIIKDTSDIIRLIYEGPKLNSIITEKLIANGLTDEHIIKLLTIELPEILKEDSEAVIVRDEVDFALLKVYDPVFGERDEEIKQFPCIISPIKAETYGYHPLDGLTISEVMEKMEAMKKAVQEVVAQIENEKTLNNCMSSLLSEVKLLKHLKENYAS